MKKYPKRTITRHRIMAWAVYFEDSGENSGSVEGTRTVIDFGDKVYNANDRKAAKELLKEGYLNGGSIRHIDGATQKGKRLLIDWDNIYGEPPKWE
jgi:hypothetical protein